MKRPGFPVGFFVRPTKRMLAHDFDGHAKSVTLTQIIGANDNDQQLTWLSGSIQGVRDARVALTDPKARAKYGD